jgi:hypothetical protein
LDQVDQAIPRQVEELGASIESHRRFLRDELLRSEPASPEIRLVPPRIAFAYAIEVETIVERERSTIVPKRNTSSTVAYRLADPRQVGRQ